MGFTLNQLEQERQIRKLQKKEDKDTSNYEQLSNLPKINNVELKGDKTTGDLGINADNVMMSDGVTSVEGAVDELRGWTEITTITTETFGTLKGCYNPGLKLAILSFTGNNSIAPAGTKTYNLPATWNPPAFNAVQPMYNASRIELDSHTNVCKIVFDGTNNWSAGMITYHTI